MEDALRLGGARQRRSPSKSTRSSSSRLRLGGNSLSDPGREVVDDDHAVAVGEKPVDRCKPMNPAPPVTIAVDISENLQGTREHPFQRSTPRSRMFSAAKRRPPSESSATSGSPRSVRTASASARVPRRDRRPAPDSAARRAAHPRRRSTGRPSAQQSNSFEGTNFDSSGRAARGTSRASQARSTAAASAGSHQRAELDRRFGPQPPASAGRPAGGRRR